MSNDEYVWRPGTVTYPSYVTKATTTTLLEKWGKMAHLSFSIKVIGTINAGNYIATLPAGYRPPYAFSFVCVKSGGSECINFAIAEDGKIYAPNNNLTDGWYVGDITFLVS